MYIYRNLEISFGNITLVTRAFNNNKKYDFQFVR